MKPNKNPLGRGRGAEGAQDTAQKPNDSTPRPLRAARRALARYDRKGCWYCGGRSDLLAVGLVGKKWRAVCAEHEGVLDELDGYSVPITEIAQARARRIGEAAGMPEIADRIPIVGESEEDRQWFEAHPDRCHRIRTARPGEWDHLAGTAYCPVGTAIRQLEPGARLRVPIGLLDESLCEAGEEEAHEVFSIAYKCYLLGRDLTPEERARCEAEAAVIGGVQ